MAEARGRYLGMELEMISVSEATTCSRCSTRSTSSEPCGTRSKGHVDPTGVTTAYAICARQAGAEVHRHTWVSALEQRKDGTWTVITDKGEIHAEHVVNAGGLWAREVGRMVGLELPVLAMQHHYLVTEEMDEVKDHMARTNREMPMVMDFAGEIYIRQEGMGMLMGTYEQDSRPVVSARDAVVLRHGAAPARPRPHLARARRRVQALPGHGDAGIKRSSTDRSPSPRTATRSSDRSVACATTGSPAG
jgi:dimethylglycine dehydrogenase